MNWDGRVLGCCYNYWGDFGNAFSDEQAFHSDAIDYAKEMLMGKATPRDDIPCTSCRHFKIMKDSQDWMRPEDIRGPLASPLVLSLLPHLGKPFVWLINRSDFLAETFLKGILIKSNSALRN